MEAEARFNVYTCFFPNESIAGQRLEVVGDSLQCSCLSGRDRLCNREAPRGTKKPFTTCAHPDLSLAVVDSSLTEVINPDGTPTGFYRVGRANGASIVATD